MNRVSKDVYNIDLLFAQTFNSMLTTIADVFVTIVVAVFSVNPYCLPLLALHLGLLYYVARLYLKSLREITRIESVSKSPIFSFYS
jgi:hypothetical protein